MQNTTALCFTEGTQKLYPARFKTLSNVRALPLVNL